MKVRGHTTIQMPKQYDEDGINLTVIYNMRKSPQANYKNKMQGYLITSEGRLEGFPDSSFGRYSAIASVTTRARRYSATPLLSTA